MQDISAIRGKVSGIMHFFLDQPFKKHENVEASYLQILSLVSLAP